MRLGDVESVLESNFNASWPVKMFTGGWPGYNGCAPDPLPDPACYGMPIRDGIKTINLRIFVMKQNNKFCVAMQMTLS